MQRLQHAFRKLREERRAGLVIYVTAGDPDLETTERLVPELERAGADVVEIGVPFTDPLADGPSVQAATERALKSGATLEQILDLVARLREQTQVPIVLMTYYN